MGARPPVVPPAAGGPRTTRPFPGVVARRVVGGVAVSVSVLVALFAPSPVGAQASNNVREIVPANGAELDTSPPAVVLVFDQEIRNDQIPVVELSCGGQPQATGLPEIDGDGLVVTTAISAPLPASTCLVAYALRDADGNNIVVGTSSFRVLNETATTLATGTAAGATPPTTDPFIRQPAVPATTGSVGTDGEGSAGGAIWLGRVLSTLGFLLLLGGLVLISVGWPEGPEYLVTLRYFRIVWTVALVGTVLHVVAFAADVGGRSFAGGVSPMAWFDLLDAGWPGRGALLRLLAVAVAWPVASRPERILDPDTAMWSWAVPLVAVAAAGLSRVEGPVAAVGYLVSVAHLLGVAVWLGGAALVSRVVLSGPGEEDLVQATRVFSKISVPAMVLTIVTGLIQMWRLDGGNLFGSGHGRVLLLKSLAVAAMLAVSVAARQQATLRLGRVHELTAPTADRFKRAFGTELAIGIVALGFSGWLIDLAPPKVDPLANEQYLDAMVFQHAPSGLDAVVRVGPGIAGPTGFRVDVRAPAEGLTSMVLRFVPPEGSSAYIVEQTIPLTGAGTAYRDDADGLPLDAAGIWRLELSASTTTGVVEAASYTFELRLPDGSQATTTVPLVTPSVAVSVVEQSTTTAPFVTTTTLVPPSLPPATSP